LSGSQYKPVIRHPPPYGYRRKRCWRNEEIVGEDRGDNPRQCADENIYCLHFLTPPLDRLLHRSTVINIRGESYRLREKRQAKTALPSVEAALHAAQ